MMMTILIRWPADHRRAIAGYAKSEAAAIIKPVKPKEWFLVPLHVIDAAVEKIRDGSITEYIYDPVNGISDAGGQAQVILILGRRACG